MMKPLVAKAGGELRELPRHPFVIFGLATMVTWMASAADPAAKTGRSDEELMFAEIPTVYAAVRRAQPVSEAPAAVSVISRDDIRKYNYRTLADALSSVPGIFLTDDRAYEHIGVRGLGIPGDYNVRLLFLLNGLPLNDKYYGNFVAELGPDMLDAIERIEVVKGPASALFGSNAIFATVNIVTRKGADLGGHAVVSGEVGSGPFGRGVLTYGEQLKNGLDLFFSGHYELSEGDRHISFGSFGRAHDADDQHLTDAYLSARYQDFFFQTWYGGRDKQIPTGQYGTIVGDDRTEVRDAWYVTELRWEKALDTDKRLMLRAYYEDYPYSGEFVYDDPVKTRNFERTLDRWAGFEAQFNWQPIEAHQVTMGAVGEYHWTMLRGHFDNAAGMRSFTYPGTDHDFPYAGVYVQDEYRIAKPLAVTAGARFDTFPDQEVSRVSPRVALVWNATDQTTVKFIYGQAFRAPSEFERTYPFGSGTGPRESGLKPETISTYELVLEQDFRHGLFGRVSAFHNDVNDLIGTRELSLAESRFANLFSVDTTGVEAELSKKFNNGVRGFVNGTFQDSFTGDRRLINSPEWIANLGVVVPIFGDKFAVSLRENFVSARQERVLNQRTEDAFLTSLTLSSENALPNWSFFLSVFNLLDEKFAVPSGPEGTPNTIPQRGRLLAFRASYKF